MEVNLSHTFAAQYDNFSNTENNFTLINQNEHQLSAKVNFFLVSTDYCMQKFNSFHCNFSAFIVSIGYILFALFIPLTIYRIEQLKYNFRNHYNLSLLWLCSILLLALIDITEFIIGRDGHIFSLTIILALVFFILSCIILIIRYLKFYSVEGSWLENLLIIFFTLSVYMLIIIARVWSKRSLSRVTKAQLANPLFYYILNTHFFIYYFVYVIFATVQVFSNAKNKCARCLTNMSYVSWILGAFFMCYYSTILPEHPLNDYIHYRNYFLLSTMIIILLQDLNFIRIKFNQREIQKTINSISMKPLSEKPLSFIKPTRESYSELEFIDNAFDTGSMPKIFKKQNQPNEDEETCFDVEEYNTRGRSKLPSYSENNLVIDETINKNYSKFTRFQRLIENNSTNLIIIFAVVLFIFFMFSTIFFLKSVSFSYYKYITPFIHPIVILITMRFKNYVCNCF